jgi:hypothetical protein
VIIIAITLFALSGLLVGFAFGALTIKHTPTATTTNSNKPVNVAIIPPKVSPTPTLSAPNVALSCPQMEASSSAYMGVTHIPDNTTAYTLAIQATDKNKGTCGNSPALQTTDITCKAWLVKHIPKGNLFNLPADYLKNADKLNASVTGTVGDQDFPELPGLTFDPTTPQTQPCNAQGQGTWKYTVSPNVDNGTYDLVVLTDYKGKAFNWSWFDITVQKNG